MVSFWDTSAVVSLLVKEEDSTYREAELLECESMVVWWGTRLELRSAMERRRREGALTKSTHAAADRRLGEVQRQWSIVRPSEFCLERAERLLALHPLRATDAFQLAAALLACNEHTKEAGFHCSDARLCEAAEREGFRVFGRRADASTG